MIRVISSHFLTLEKEKIYFSSSCRFGYSVGVEPDRSMFGPGSSRMLEGRNIRRLRRRIIGSLVRPFKSVLDQLLRLHHPLDVVLRRDIVLKD